MLALVAVMATPAFAEAPTEHWIPYGLLDRVQIAPPRVSVSTEIGSHDSFERAGLTLHAMASTSCMCRIGVYGTLPMSFSLVEPIGLAAAGVGTPLQPSRSGFGTADVGLFLGDGIKRANTSTYRIGALLPTAPSHGGPRITSARVGDRVLELPRSAGMRFSTGRELGWMSIPSRWLVDGIHAAWRIDTGVDLAVELDRPDGAGKRMHVIPRAGAGMLFTRYRGSLSIETVLSLDPTDEANLNLRWSTGVTGRLVRPHGGSLLVPGVTLAVVRTPESWGATIALDLAVTAQRKQRAYAYDE